MNARAAFHDPRVGGVAGAPPGSSGVGTSAIRPRAVRRRAAPWGGPVVKEQRLPAVRMIVDVLDHAPGKSALVVSTPDSRETILVAGVASETAVRDELPDGCHPLAVRVEVSSHGPVCTCIATTPSGPRRIALSVPAGLALVRQGFHGIVTDEHDREPAIGGLAAEPGMTRAHPTSSPGTFR
jgi:hypothetical protein